jgi:hypothetical protein
MILHGNNLLPFERRQIVDAAALATRWSSYDISPDSPIFYPLRTIGNVAFAEPNAVIALLPVMIALEGLLVGREVQGVVKHMLKTINQFCDLELGPRNAEVLRKFDLAEQDLAACMLEIERGSEASKADVNQAHRALLFLAHFAKGQILDEKTKHEEAAKEMRIADEIFNRLSRHGKSALESLRVKFLCNFAMILSKIKDAQGALERAQAASVLINELVKRNRREYSPLLPLVLNCLAIRQSQAGMPREALVSAQKNFKVTRELFERNHRQFAPDYQAALHTLGRRYEDCGEELKSKFFLREACRRVLRVVSDD